jgi:hypothetical protein
MLRFYIGRPVGWLLVAICFILPGLQAAEQRWLRGTSPHFEMLSLSSEKDSRNMLRELELFRENVLAVFSGRSGREPRVVVYLFPSEKTFRPYLPLYQGKPKQVAGYFINGEDEVVIAFTTENEASDFEDATETIFHEYVHLLLHTRGLHPPAWLDEGLADVFSTFRVEGKTVTYGRPKELYVALLQNTALMPLQELLHVTHDSADYNEEMRATMFYAQSWAFTHYLLCGTERSNSAKLSRYIDVLNAPDANAHVAFQEIFGTDFSKLEHGLRSYLEGGSYYQRHATIKPIDDSLLQVHPATEFERDLALCSLRYRVHRAGDSKLRLLQLAEQQPESPRPHELLGLIARDDHEDRSAVDRWQKAIELKSDNAFVYVQAARAALAGFTDDDFDARLTAVDALQLQRWLDRALTLRPGYGEAIETLARVEARAPTLRIFGVNLVQKGVPFLRDPNPTLFALAMIRWRANDLATCAKIIDAIVASSRATPELRAAARALKLRATDMSSPGSSAAPAPAQSAPALAPRGNSLLDPKRRGTGAGPSAPATFIEKLSGEKEKPAEEAAPLKYNLSETK